MIIQYLECYPMESIILCVKILMSTLFNYFSFILHFKTYSYKALFYPKVIKAHWYTDLPNNGIIRYK